MLKSDLHAKELRKVLETQYERDFWIVDVDHCKSKQHFLGYVARYVRRPPIAQRRFVKVTEREVEFLTKDKRLQQVVTTRYSIKQFIALWGDQVPEAEGAASASGVRVCQSRVGQVLRAMGLRRKKNLFTRKNATARPTANDAKSSPNKSVRSRRNG